MTDSAAARPDSKTLDRMDFIITEEEWELYYRGHVVAHPPPSLPPHDYIQLYSKFTPNLLTILSPTGTRTAAPPPASK
jgi:hypothetical protein